MTALPQSERRLRVGNEHPRPSGGQPLGVLQLSFKGAALGSRDAEGGVRVLFRRYRDVHGVYDWGFDLYQMAWDGRGWCEPIMVSHAAGFPERQYLPVRMALGVQTEDAGW